MFDCRQPVRKLFIVQLKEERDAMVREGEHLKAELEEERRGREKDRDEIEELHDRVANLRVQAQSKMVSQLFTDICEYSEHVFCMTSVSGALAI